MQSGTLAPARPAAATPRQRDASIETLRGFAIVLVVGYHALADLPAGPSITADLDIYQYVGESLRFVRMPLFTIISGFVYAMRPVGPGRLRTFFAGKARRILVPYLVASVLLLILTWTVGMGELTVRSGDLLGHLLVGVQHLWYLPAILVVFAIVVGLEARATLGSGRRAVIAVLIASAISFVVATVTPISVTELLPISTSAYLLPYFLFGLGCRRFGWHRSPGAIVVATFAAALALALQHLALHGVLDVPLGRHGAVATIGGIATTTLLLRLGAQQVWIARLGGFSMTIYLYHYYGLSVGKTVGGAFALGPTGILATKVAFGLALPVVFELVAARFRVGQSALGVRPTQRHYGLPRAREATATMQQ